MCGEHQSIGSPPPGLAGSSPRVRGTRSFDDPVHRQRGIIPACAGNTDTRDIFPLGGRDHPRVCGEHEAHPALAGGSGDHPRVCGEHWAVFRAIMRLAGSSPRVRGTLAFVPLAVFHRGIIPACAGNTSSGHVLDLIYRDHPRVCGEHLPSFLLPSFIAGSSPRVRGTPGGALVDLRMTGIIPACAGNTAWPWLRWLMFRDHPRVCGEHLDGGFAPRRCGGSSPRVRGTHGRHVQNRTLAGIIPACAGNTPAKAASPSRNRDHPRVCGEHSVTASGHACMRGSSPRVRGTRRMS